MQDPPLVDLAEGASGAARVRQLLAAGEQAVVLRIVGGSMAPFLRPGDRVRLVSLDGDDRDPAIGELVAFGAAAGHVVVHRVVARGGESVLTRGDASPSGDGSIELGGLLGRVVAAERRGLRLRLGLGPERRVIAWLSRHDLLRGLVSILRRSGRRRQGVG